MNSPLVGAVSRGRRPPAPPVTQNRADQPANCNGTSLERSALAFDVSSPTLSKQCVGAFNLVQTTLSAPKGPTFTLNTAVPVPSDADVMILMEPRSHPEPEF